MSETVAKTQEPDTDAPLTVTDEAAEQLRAVIDGSEHDITAVRLLVQAGGCCGMQYGMALADGEPTDIETAFETGGLTFYVDTQAVQVIQGSTLKWVETPGGGAFTVDNPNVENGACGC